MYFFYRLGMKYFYLGNFHRAIEYHQLHLRASREVGDRSGEGCAYSNLGMAYHKLGDFKKAIGYHQLHLDIAKEISDRSGEGNTYCNLGSAYRNLGDFRKAMEYYQLHLNIAKELKDRAGEGSAYGNLGIVYRKMGDLEKSLEYQKLYLTIVKEVGDRCGEGGAYSNLGNTYLSLGNFRKAIEYHELDLSIAKQVEDRSAEGRAHANLGITYESLGDFRKAIEYHLLHLSIAKELGDRIGEGCAYGNLGNAYDALGNFRRAIEYHKLRLHIVKAVGDRAGEGGAYSGLGNAYSNIGDFKTAIEYHHLDLSIAKELGDRFGEGSANANLGIAYRKLGDFKKAVKYHQLHLSIAEQVGDRAGVGRAYANIAVAYRSLRNFEEAIKYNHRHLDIVKELGDRSGEGHGYCNLGTAYQSLGDFKTAIEYFNLYLGIAKELRERAGEGSACGNLGVTYCCQGDFKNALEYHQQHLAIAKEVGDRSAEGLAYSNLGLTYYHLGDLSKAEECYKSSVRVLDNIANLLLSKDEWKISLRDCYKDRCTSLWLILLKQDKILEALLTAERGRGPALMDLMESQYGIQLSEPGSEEKMERTSHILSYISSQTIFLAVSTNEINFWVLQKGEEPRFVNKKIDEKYFVENAITSLVSLNENAYSKIGVLKSVKCEDRSMDDPITADEETPSQIPARKGSISSDKVGDSLKALYDVIMKPIADLINGNEITIVPDGPLFLAPFAAFVDQQSQYLSETFTIRLIPTLSSLKMMATCPEGYHSKTGALLVGDPWVGNVRIETKGQKKGKKKIRKKGQKEEKEKGLPQLPAARKEVELIGKILKTEPLTGEKATKEEVLRRLSSVALVHIAAHGKAETGEIALSPNPTQTSGIPKEEDYLLKMEDVKNANMQAKLVVLSCCHSGRGEIKSEGVVGIARAFLGAGARSVLASLWAISDEATQEFMSNFYNNLARGLCASRCLNQAMKVMRESDRFGRVEHWAPFVLIGDDVTLDFGQAR